MRPRRKRGGAVPVNKTYSTELLANGRHRYEKTAEPVAAIAADFRIHPGSLRRLGERLGWVRFGMAPRQLPVTSRLLAQADELAAAQTYGEVGTSPLPREPPTDVPADLPASLDVDVIARIERQVLTELSEIEAMRVQLSGLPRRTRDAETTARALTTLTDTLQKLQRLRLALRPNGQTHDDLTDQPSDLDEFRLDLARRIDAFVASRTDTADAGTDEPIPAMEATEQ